MQQIYRRTPIPKCDFNKVAKQHYWSCTSAMVFSYKFAAYFQDTFFKKHLWTAVSVFLRFQFSLLKLSQEIHIKLLDITKHDNLTTKLKVILYIIYFLIWKRWGRMCVCVCVCVCVWVGGWVGGGGVWVVGVTISKSSHHRCSVRRGVLRNFTKFTEKAFYRTPLDNCFWISQYFKFNQNLKPFSAWCPLKGHTYLNT